MISGRKLTNEGKKYFDILFVSPASAVKFNHILKDLFLGDNKLMPNDGQPLSEMLKGNEHLQLLDLRNNPLQVNCYCLSV